MIYTDQFCKTSLWGVLARTMLDKRLSQTVETPKSIPDPRRSPIKDQTDLPKYQYFIGFHSRGQVSFVIKQEIDTDGRARRSCPITISTQFIGGFPIAAGWFRQSIRRSTCIQTSESFAHRPSKLYGRIPESSGRMSEWGRERQKEAARPEGQAAAHVIQMQTIGLRSSGGWDTTQQRYLPFGGVGADIHTANYGLQGALLFAFTG